MRDLVKRIILQSFPELSGGYHLPHMAEIVGIADTPAAGDLADDFRPHYAVDLQVLTAHGVADNKIPLLTAVPLPTSVCGGAEMGAFGFPQRGTRVMLMFAYGSPNQPVITSIYPHGGALPKVAEGELLLQQRTGVQQRIDAAGNMLRQTDGKINDECQDHTLDALTSTVTLQKEDITVTGNATRTVKGSWVNRVLGAARILAAETLNISSGQNMSLMSATDLNVNVARNMAQSVKEKASLVAKILEQTLEEKASLEAKILEQTLEETAKITAGESLHLESPACYIGDSSNNLFKMVSDLAQAVIDLADAYALHTHMYIPGVLTAIATAVPSNATTGMTVSLDSETVKDAVDAMTGG